MSYTSLENKIRKVMAEAAADRNTKLRMKVTNVGRPDTATDPTDVKSKLAKQGEIKTKIIDEASAAKKAGEFHFGNPDDLHAHLKRAHADKDQDSVHRAIKGAPSDSLQKLHAKLKPQDGERQQHRDKELFHLSIGGELKRRGVKEEVEQIDEISLGLAQDTLAKRTAQRTIAMNLSKTASANGKDPSRYDSAAKKAGDKAFRDNEYVAKKLPEEVEQIEELSTQDSLKDEPETKKKKQDKALVEPGTIKGGTTEVDLEPTTDDRNDDGKKETDKAKKATREANKLAGVKEETMLKSNSTFGLPADLIATVAEALKGNQKNIDKNHNGKVDAQDFKILRGETKAKVKPEHDKARPAFKSVEEASDEKLDTKGPDGKMPYSKTKKIVNKVIEPFKEESDPVLSDEETARLEEIVKSLS
jgi:hypothetical protein